MADEELEQDGEEQQEEEGKAKSSKKKWIIIGLAIVLLAGISVAGTLFLLGGDDELPEDAEAEELVEEEVPEVSAAIYYPMKPEFITNYEVRGRQRYMQLSVTLMLRENDVVAGLELHMPALRNAMVMLLRGQDYQELQTAEGKELLRQQSLLKIQEVLQQEIGKPGIEQVLFTNLVLQ